MKVYLVLGLLALTGCGGWPYLLSPEVIKELKDDHASVCVAAEGGPVGIGSGILAMCRANSDGHSKLTVNPDGSMTVEHNIAK